MVTHADTQTDHPRAGEVHALVLAAGAGTRMGGDKLRRLWRGRPLVAWAVEAALAAPVERVWLVTGRDPALAETVRADPRLGVVHARLWAQGLSTSLKAGVAALPPSTGAVIVFLADMPRVPPPVCPALVEAWRGDAVAAAPSFKGERGHPVLLDRSLFATVDAIEGDRGAGALLAGLGDRLALIPCADDGVLFDVDTPQALEG